MGRKNSKRPKKSSRDPKDDLKYRGFDPDEDMDDEIDAFHKQRDVIPLDVDADVDDELEDDSEQPVFDLKVGDSDSDSKEDDGVSNDDNDDEKNGVEKYPSLAAKIARQAKFLRHRIAGVEEDIDGEDEQEDEKRTVWGRHKNLYFGADNADFELLSSDAELQAEEDEALRMQREKAKSFSMEDFGLEDSDKDDDDDDRDGKEKSLKDIFVADREKTSGKVMTVTENYVEINKDLDALSKEEKMDIVYSSAPELVGLLSELNEALEQWKVTKSFLSKVRESNCRGAVRYLELKQLLMLAYCQAIGFYLLLKSEGHSVRDHPVLARLVELKDLVEKVKKIDENVPSEIVIESKNDNPENQEQKKAVNGSYMLESKLGNKDQLIQENKIDAFGNVCMSEDRDLDNGKLLEQNVLVGLQSKEMLELRASLEEKLKQKGIYNFIKQKPGSSCNHTSRAVNKHLESMPDFDDEAAEPVVSSRAARGQTSSLSAKLSQMVGAKGSKHMLVSGDDDLPARDDIGERRRKHELRVLAKVGAGVGVDENDNLADENGGSKRRKIENGLGDGDRGKSEDGSYKEVKKQKVSKLSGKDGNYSSNQLKLPTLPEAETETDGKRLITYQIEKNRGLTRHRKKEIKNPRKKYKMKHKKAMTRRKGQVREIRKPCGPYGGETTGINTSVSRSIRFKN